MTTPSTAGFNMPKIKDFSLDKVNIVTTSISSTFFNVSNLKVSEVNEFTYGLDMAFELFVDFDEKVLVDVGVFKKKSKDASKLMKKIKGMTFSKAISNVNKISLLFYAFE